MLLYQDPRAPNPRRVRVFLAEKGVAYDTIEVLIADAAHQTAAFRQKNPIAQLPVLELDDGRVLRESMAICRYLEELHPEPNLFGADAWERAQIEIGNSQAGPELMLPLAIVFRNTHKSYEGRIKQSAEFGALMRELVGERFAWLERELAARPYMAGERFTVADITALCAIDWGKPSGVRLDPELHPNLTAWYQRVAARPSTKA